MCVRSKLTLLKSVALLILMNFFSGPLPKIPIIVKARYFSREAEMKIKEAGGVCIVTA